jgi:hypothetical protein
MKFAQDAVRAIARRTSIYAGRLAYTGNNQNFWEYFIFKNINWRRLLLHREEADAELERLNAELGDEDENGIPDLYDGEVTSPSEDILGIKYPQTLLRENDYIRYLPRNVKNLAQDAQPVPPGAKGIVRSETVNNTGAYAWVKWNIYSMGEGRPAILHRANQMDLSLLGHVYDSYRVTT